MGLLKLLTRFFWIIIFALMLAGAGVVYVSFYPVQDNTELEITENNAQASVNADTASAPAAPASVPGDILMSTKEKRAFKSTISQKRNDAGLMQSTLHVPKIEKKPYQEPAPLEKIPAFQVNGLATADLDDDIMILNLFSMWCDTCKKELSLFNTLSDEYGIPVYGVNIFMKDEDDAAVFFEYAGDPYKRRGSDDFKLITNALKLKKTPVTYIITRDLDVHWQHQGEITQEMIHGDIIPLIQSLKAKQEHSGE